MLASSFLREISFHPRRFRSFLCHLERSKLTDSRIYRTTFSTHSFSSLRTSSLKFSTSFQQLSGLRSLAIRHWMTSLRDFSTVSGSWRSCFRLSRRARRASTSLDTAGVLLLLASFSVSADSRAFFWAAVSASDSFADSFFSSSATRAWTASSMVWARDLSVCRSDDGQRWGIRVKWIQAWLACRLRTSVLPCSDSTISCDTPRGPELYRVDFGEQLIDSSGCRPQTLAGETGAREEWFNVRTPSSYARLGRRPSWRSSRPLW